MVGTVFPKQEYDDRSDYGRLAHAIEANPDQSSSLITDLGWPAASGVGLHSAAGACRVLG
jgi:hypothetical protein